MDPFTGEEGPMDYEKAYADLRELYEKAMDVASEIGDSARPVAPGAMTTFRIRMQEFLDEHDVEFGGDGE